MGAQLRWLERTPDKREVGGSSPLEPTTVRTNRRGTLKENTQRGVGLKEAVCTVLRKQKSNEVRQWKLPGMKTKFSFRDLEN